MGKKNISMEEQLKRYKKKFFIVLSILIIFIGAVGLFVYSNYNYLAFKYFITGHYIYTDALDELYQKNLKKAVNGKYFSYFDDVVISVVTKSIREINKDKYTYLYIPEQYQKYKEEMKAEALQSQIKALNSKTIYLSITNFSKYTKNFVEDNVDTLKEYPFIIIDLRDNYGGDTTALYKMADLFLPKGSVLSRDSMRIFDWTYKAKKEQRIKYEKIIILQNNNTASSAENFIAALKDNLSNVQLLGEATFGKGIGQFTLPLKRGFAVKATTMLWYTPNGINIQGKGIAPDIEYNKDDIINFALDNLKQ